MNPQEIHQVTAHDEKWVPTKERVKISTTNLRLETTVQQKEETFQVMIDVIVNYTCFKAFTISAEVPKILMQQLCYTIKKVEDTESYEFLLANKKFKVDVEVFWKILVCPRVQVHYTITPACMDHIHQPWRTLAAIINNCLSSKTASNDRLRKSRIDILWGIFYRENVDYPALIWEDLAFQMDNRQLKKGRREIIPYPRITKIIINHFLFIHESLIQIPYLHTYSIKDDGTVSILKFVRTGEDFQEYDLPIPKTMLTDGIKQSESYQTFIKYSTGQIPPKKSRGKVSQGKKSVDVPKADVGVFKESDSKHARKRTTSRRVIKKNVTISVDESIIPDPYVDLELGKSISLTEAAEEEAASQFHATHERIKLKGVQSLTPKEKLVADIIRALKESKKTSRRQPGTRGSSKGTGRIPGVLDESTVLSTTSSEGTGNKSRVPEDLRDDEEVDCIYFDKDDEKKDDVDDDKSIDLEMTNDEETEDEFVQGKEQVNDDEDKEITNAKVEESGNGDVKISDAAKADAEKTEEV
nr:hypothetical protein [Tanacetum cinerariifolium]